MKKEIIIVTISLGNDGAERILTELARQWVHDGHHITVIQTSPNRYGNEYRRIPVGQQKLCKTGYFSRVRSGKNPC